MLAAVALVLATPLRGRVAGALPATVCVLLAAGGALGWRFKRGNAVMALALLALTTAALVARPDATFTRDVLAVVVPVHLAALAWLPDRGLLTARARPRLAVLGGEILLLGMLTADKLVPPAGVADLPLVTSVPPRIGLLAQPALVAVVLAVATILVRAVRAPNSEDAGTLWAIAGVVMALAARDQTTTLAWLGGSALALVVALVETSYGLAYVDELTGLPGRRALESALRQLSGRYAIAMVDVDHFKRFNDDHGHPVGDQLLRMVAASLGRTGGGGRAFRYGGEEFAILFHGKTAAEAVPHLETVRKRIAATPFTVRAAGRRQRRPERRSEPPGRRSEPPARRPAPAVRPSQPNAGRVPSIERPPREGGRQRVGVTVSIGVAAARPGASDPHAVLDAADAALYRAKREGRDRVVRA